MRSLLLLSLAFAIPALADTPPECDKTPTLKSGLIDAAHIDWAYGSPPAEISTTKVFKVWAEGLPTDAPDLRYSWINFSNSKTPHSDVFIQELLGGTGGFNSLLLHKTSKGWQEALTFQGGWVFQAQKNAPPKLTVFVRSGIDRSKYTCTYSSKNARYQCSRPIEVPRNSPQEHGNDNIWFEFFWYLNQGCWGSNKVDRHPEFWIP